MKRRNRLIRWQGLVALGGIVGVDVASAALLTVPEQYPSIQSALNGAASGDSIMIDGAQGPYREPLSIKAEKLGEITLFSNPTSVRAEIYADSGQYIMLALKNEQNLPFRVVLDNLAFDGMDTAPTYGVRLYNAPSEAAEALSTVVMKDVTITRCGYGIQIGTKTGIDGCDGKWGAVDWTALEQSTTRVELLGCAVTECTRDAVRLYDVTGFFEHSLIAYNGDEALHSTGAHEFSFSHNIMARNQTTTLHFQVPGRVYVTNNMVATSVDRPTSNPPVPGIGIAVGGSLNEDTLFVNNNALIANASSGVKINPVEVVYGPGHCEARPSRVYLQNNTFVSNGFRSRMQKRFQVQYKDGPGSFLGAHYNQFRERTDLANFELDPTNVGGIEPGFSAPVQAGNLPDSLENPLGALSMARTMIEGYALRDSVAAIDAGAPGDHFFDGGGLARGSVRNDAGIFGGPGSDWARGDSGAVADREKVRR